MKIVKRFQPKIVIFTAMKNRCILHGRVFVIAWADVQAELMPMLLVHLKSLLNFP